MCKNKLLIDSLFNILKNLFSENKIVYVSTPINTGERFINWYSLIGKNIIDANEFNKERFTHVILPNIRDAKENVKKIREKTSKIVIDPTNFENEMLGWSQDQFYEFWDKVIKTLVNYVVFLDGWEFSIGCCFEILSAIESGVDIYFQCGKILTIEEVVDKLNNSINVYKSNNLSDWKKIYNILEKIKKYVNGNFYKDIKYDGNMKDEKLNNLITNENINIAQFVSFDPDLNLEPRFIHINNFKYKKNMTKEDVLKELILSAGSRTVNIRSFSPKVMKGNRLVIGKGIEDLDKILNIIKDNSLEGKYSIVNENIDINDGGVSGVILGDVIEFSPEDTPKCVEKDGVCSLPKDIGFKVLHNVYGFYPNINFEPNHRVEFSIHPSRQGIKREHTIIWEYEHYENIEYEIKISWPNKFSRFIGDKVFGLLIAEALGIKVPKTTVISRKVAPFSFGIETGLEEKWIRTCPIIKEPGKYYTGMNWIDPFELMNKEETKGKGEVNIASIICQEAVEPLYSGGAIIKEKEEDDLIEGVLGRGDNFMVGSQNKEELPREIIMKVQELNNKLRNNYGKIGEVTIEWVYDGKDVWVVQLNQLKRNDNNLDRSVIVNGNPLYYEDFFVSEGLDVLRKKIETVKGKNIGIKLVGNIGITSHFGDLLRLANIPSILKRID